MTQIVRIFSLEGKDYLDQYEAAHYMCMSLSRFKQLLTQNIVKPLNNHGKVVYLKDGLRKVIENQNAKK